MSEADDRAQEAIRDVVTKPTLLVGRIIVYGVVSVAVVGAVVAAALLWPDAPPPPQAVPTTGRSPSGRTPRRRGR